jgi:hypothetical protein
MWLAQHRESILGYLPESHPWDPDLVDRHTYASWHSVSGHLAYLRCQNAAAAKHFDEALLVLPEHLEPWEYAREEGIFEGLKPPWCRGAR